MIVALTCAAAAFLQPPAQPPQPATDPSRGEPNRPQTPRDGERTETDSRSSQFSAGVFPLGATMVSADRNGELSIETVSSETTPRTATRTVPVQGPDGQTQLRTEQFTVTTTIFKVTRKALPPGTKIYRNGREISAEEKRSLRERTPLFVTQLGSSNTPPGQGYEAVFGHALVAFVPSGGRAVPARPDGQAMKAPQPTVPIGEPSPVEKEVVDKVNEARKAADLPPFKIDATLTKAARQHSENMAKVGKLDHVLDGKGPTERLSDLGMRPSSTGENVAQGQRSAAEAMETWMSSPAHRGNILNQDFTHLGVAKADSANGPYWTQVFARIEPQP
jgi:uncharacterized protein YkwD